MPTLDVICNSLASIAPLGLAESWDNVGLLVGDRSAEVGHVMTCLTITPDVVDEAESEHAQLIVVHHPLPFKALPRITTDSIPGGMLLRLIRSGVAVYSAHTAFDSATLGINQMWADAFDLQSVAPLVDSSEDDSAIGSGRCGHLPDSMRLREFIQAAAKQVGATAPRMIGDGDQPIKKVAFACGSGGSFLAATRRKGCDALLTGEATFHTCLEAESSRTGLGLLGHYWSERFAMERLAEHLADEIPDITVWPSRREHDPIQVV